MVDKPGPSAEHSPDPAPSAISRRSFLKGASLTVAAAGAGLQATAAGAREQSAEAVRMVGPGAVEIELSVNGKTHKLEVEPSMTLLDTVRDRLDLTGAKRVCDRGSCGACTMLLDGRPVNACMLLAVDAVGRTVTTVEGLTPDGSLSPLQTAFVECDAMQCGFCTPGMVVACEALLRDNPSPTRDDVKHAIAGNICRCGTYQNIFEAVELASRKGKGRAK